MPSIQSGNQSFPVAQVRKLKSPDGLNEMRKKSDQNQLDEVFFEYAGETYLALGESINTQSLLSAKGPVKISLDLAEGPVNIKLLGADDEINSWSEGWAKGQSVSDSFKKAWTGAMASPNWSSVHGLSESVGRMGPVTQPPAVEPPVTSVPPVKPISPTPPPVPVPTATPSEDVIAPQEANSDIEAYFSQVHDGTARTHPNNPDKKLAEFIRSADKTLDIAAFELDSEIIKEAILEAHKNNVKVRVVTDSNYVHEADIQALKAAGIEVIDDQRSGLMHNKFVVADLGTQDAAVWTGSFNFTENGAWKNANNALKIRSNALAQNFTQEFEEMFVDRRFGRTSPQDVKNPVVHVGHSRIETYFAAEGRVAGKVAEALNTAEKSIHFMAFSFTHDAIGEVVAQKFETGKVEVRGVFENVGSGTKYSEYGNLKKIGADVKVDGNPNVKTLHHKVFIIDGKKVVMGSFNFSQSADLKNDENLLIIEDAALAQKYEAEFKKVYAHGKVR